MRRGLAVLAVVAGSLSASPLRADSVTSGEQSVAPPAAPAPPPAPAPRKVVLILIDGVRQRELLGNATDDNGKPVRASELMPNITALRKSGLFFSRMRISNPAGVSLPAYA